MIARLFRNNNPQPTLSRRSRFIGRLRPFIARSAFILGGGVLLALPLPLAAQLTEGSSVVYTSGSFTITGPDPVGADSPATYSWRSDTDATVLGTGKDYTNAAGLAAAGTYVYWRGEYSTACSQYVYSYKHTVTTVTTPPPPGAASTQTWSYGGLTWSDRVVAKPDNCAEVNSLTTSNYTTAEYKIDNSSGVERYYYSWACATGGTSGGTNAQLCPSPWRLPTQSDFDKLVGATNYSTLIDEWGYGGYVTSSSMLDVSVYASYWSSTPQNSTGYAYRLAYYNGNLSVSYSNMYNGFQVRCVK